MAGNELKAGNPVEAVMAKYGLMDSQRIDAGDQFDFAAKIKLGVQTFDVASKMQSGEVSQPFVLRGDINADVHIIYMIKRMPPVPRDYTAAHDSVLQDFKRESVRRLETDNLNYLKGNAEIVVAPEFRQ